MQVRASTQADGHRYPAPLILPVEKEDAGPISVFSFEATAWSPMGAFFHPSPADRAKAVHDLEAGLLASLDDPAHFMVMKAVDPETGELASYAIWERISHRDRRTAPDAAREEGEVEKLSGALSPPGPKKDEEKKAGEAENPDDPHRSLGAYISAETTRFRDAWAVGMDYIELRGLATAPQFQRRGYATALMEWGHRWTDGEGRVGFLVGSPMARPLYASLGWHEVGQIIVDMREWVPGARAGDRGWGTWKLYHMIRLPRAVT